jgi:hypothetical protein
LRDAVSLSKLQDLTPSALDRYAERVFDIEEDWRSLYSKKVVKSLRQKLMLFDKLIEHEVPDYPDVSGWLNRR